MITRDNVKIIKRRGVKIDTSEIIRGEICLFILTLMRHSKFHAYCAVYVNYMNHGLLICALTFYNLNEIINYLYINYNDIIRYWQLIEHITWFIILPLPICLLFFVPVVFILLPFSDVLLSRMEPMLLFTIMGMINWWKSKRCKIKFRDAKYNIITYTQHFMNFLHISPISIDLLRS